MSKVDQVEYLKKYLPEEKKKRKKKDAGYTPRVKIIDDDVDIVKSRLYCQDELILTGEDAPQIVGVIDDRPPELKTIEDFRNSEKWKRVSKSASGCEVDTQSNKTSSESFSKKQSAASRHEKVDVIQSTKINSSYYEKDLEFNLQKDCSLLSNDVLSPKRKNRRKSDDFSPERKGGRHSIEQKKTLDSFSKSIRNSDEKRSRRDPRRQTKFSKESSPELCRTDSKVNITSRKSRSKSSDYSPPRKRDSQRNSIDLSPRSCQKRIKQSSYFSQNSDQDGNDYSPPRKTATNSMCKNVGNSNQKTKGDMRENIKIERTLDGKKAGLQDAKALKSETEIFRRKEDDTFRKMSSDISGKNAELVVRAKRRKADTESKREKEQEKTKREQKKQEAYNRWGVGLKQIQNYQNKVADEMVEISKPLARYSNDADLDDMLKGKEREGDPMLAYIREKNNEMKKYSNIPTVPIYKGPFPENRFNIRPGYRWDGVDRSNGYEKKWFDNQNQKKAIQEEAYKYSIEDM